jgi:hypothetical protein
MKCMFCQDNDLEYIAYNGHESSYKCIKCCARFWYKFSSLREYEFYFIYNNKTYVINWDIDNITRIFESNSDREQNIILNGKCGLTPHNIAQKLPLILTFS